MGQLKAVAKTFYNLNLDIEVINQEVVFDTIHVSFQVRPKIDSPIWLSLSRKVTKSPLQLKFENDKVPVISSALIREEARLPAVSSSILFEIFPFIMVFGEDMVIQSIGRSLEEVLVQHM